MKTCTNCVLNVGLCRHLMRSTETGCGYEHRVINIKNQPYACFRVVFNSVYSYLLTIITLWFTIKFLATLILLNTFDLSNMCAEQN